MNTAARDTKVKALTLWNRHRTLIISGAVTVVVLALVIIGVAAFGPTKSAPSGTVPEPGVTTLSESDQLLQQAQQAAASGDTTKAADLANQALVKNPDNTGAKTLLEKLQASSSGGSGSGGSSSSGTGGSSGSSGSGSNGTTVSDAAFLKAAATMRQWLPATFSGFSLGSSVENEGDATVGATAAGGGNASAVLWSVHDRKDRAGAKKFVDKTSKVLYPKDVASLSIDGTTAYFGTDGTRFATVVYVRGRYTYEVVVTGNGTAPKNLKTLAQKAAAAFSDAPPK